MILSYKNDITCDEQINDRPLFTVRFKKQVLDLVYGLSHPEIKATQKLISEHFAGPNIKIDKKNFCSNLRFIPKGKNLPPQCGRFTTTSFRRSSVC